MSSLYISSKLVVTKTNWLAGKIKFFFYAILPFKSSDDAAVQI